MNKRQWWLSFVMVGLLTACGEPSVTPTVTAPNIDLMVGTLNLGEGQGNATHFVVYLFSSEALSDTNVSVTVTGPGGWNNNQAFVFEPRRTNALLKYGWLAFPILSATALAGDYKLEVSIKGKLYSVSDALNDPAFKLLAPTVTATGSSSSVSVSWTAVTGATSYSVGLYKGDYETQIGIYQSTKATNYSFSNLNLAPGTYLVEVAPSNVDFTAFPVKQKPYGVSFANASFNVN
jgi:hypothetical protein